LRFLFSNAEVTPIELGYFMPQMRVGSSLETGEVGYIATGLKDIRFAKVGDTVTTVSSVKHQVVRKEDLTPDALTPDTIQPLAGYREPKPMVFLGLFPVAADEFQDAREAMEKLRLSDSAFTFRPISSLALGNGFHCGFLGLLHAEIVQERLLREFGLTLLATAPSVEYLIQLNPGVNPGKVGIKQLSAFSYQPSEKSLQLSAISDQHSININTSKEAESCGLSLDGARDPELAEGKADSFYSITSASEYPDPSVISETREPVMQVSVFSPKKYVGGIMGLCQEKRGEYIDLEYIGSAFSGHESDKDTAGIAKFTYLMPLSEMIVDFFDRLKSATEGYASLDYEFFEYQVVDVVKMDILVNKEKVDAFATLVVKDQALRRGRELTERLAAAIPKQQFEIPVQAALGGQVIARADVKAFRKDVIAKLYGGDRTRKDKLLDKQKKGKAKMKLIGRVEIPQSAFFAVLKRE